MSFPRYPEYKDSGVEWLGAVPGHWLVIPLKRDIEFVTSGARGWAENYADDGDLFLRIGNLTRDSIRLDLSDTQRVVVPDGAEVDRTQVQAGDILFSITAYLGSVAVVPAGLGRAFVSQHVALVRPSKKHCLSEWLAYVAISYVGKTHLETTGYGGTKVQLSLADVTSLPMVVPPIDEQTALVEFLDRETAKIDALVAEQERLIALLQEKRQAVISHAVTKGLDPNVPMKDSGVEWLGEVPGHWEVGALSYLSTIETGSTPDRNDDRYWNGSIPWLKTGEINWAPIREAEEFITEEGLANSAAKLSPAGTMLMAMYGQGVTRGRVALLEIEAAYNQACAAITFCPRIRSTFGRYFFMAAYDHIREGGNETSQMNLSAGLIAKFRMTIPPIDEQTKIVNRLDAELAKLDVLSGEAELAITLLQERRTALISAAVTGQIDVRGLAGGAIAPDSIAACAYPASA